MELVKPEPLIIDGVAHFTLTSYDPVSIEVDVPPLTDADIDQAMLMSVAELGGTPASLNDDAWIRENFEGVGNARELRETIREQMLFMSQEYAEEQKTVRCSIELAHRLMQRVSTKRVSEVRRMIDTMFEASLKADGITMDQFLAQSGMRREEFEGMLDLRAQGEAETEAALDAWVEHYRMTVADEELPDLLGIDPEQAEQFLKQMNATGEIKDARTAALRSKALAEVVNGCECTYHHEAPSDQGGNGAGPSLKLV